MYLYSYSLICGQPPPPPPSPQATPLFLACYWNIDLKAKQCMEPVSEAALLLLSKGANPNKAATIENMTIEDREFPPLEDGEFSKENMENMTMENGDAVVTVETPLFHAVVTSCCDIMMSGSTEVVRSLLESGARQDLDTGGEELNVHNF